jgi:hypothetical protein
MALFPCPECQKDVSDKARACPHCGTPTRSTRTRRKRLSVALGAVLVALVATGLVMRFRRNEYGMVERLRAEQDGPGTRNEHVRQRFYRLFREHPDNAMYIYLWARCIDDPQKRLDLAEQGIRADPRFSWNYNLAARALAQQNRVQEAYDDAVKGSSLDPGNMQLNEKRELLKLVLDNKLMEQPKPAPNAYAVYESKESFEKGAVRYRGLFRGPLRGAGENDAKGIEKNRVADLKAVPGDPVKGFHVCTNPFSDTCIRVYTVRAPLQDAAHAKVVWMQPGLDVGTLKDNQLVTVSGSVVPNGKGENILLADSVTVEAR